MITNIKPKKILMWALTYKCNAKCEYCYLKNHKFPYEDLNKEEVFAVASKIINNTDFHPDAVWLTGGEPTVLDYLPDLISLFQKNGIKIVLNTNGVVKDEKLLKILAASPCGIIISLDTLNTETSSKRYFSTETIVERIKFIAKNKSSNTILGTAVVINDSTAEELYNYAMEVKSLGVEYVSLNPLHGDNVCFSNNEILSMNIKSIKQNEIVKLPNEFYLNFMSDYLRNDIPFIDCPAMDSFFFISPWGYIYPCSNELWQKDENAFNILKSENWYKEALTFFKSANLNNKTTKSNCFSARCVGCWKLYFDSIFS